MRAKLAKAPVVEMQYTAKSCNKKTNKSLNHRWKYREISSSYFPRDEFAELLRIKETRYQQFLFCDIATFEVHEERNW